jgi:putative ABC transport system permease protein
MPDRLYRTLLRALPLELRREFGEDMVQLFRDHRRQVAGAPFAVAALWLAAVSDVARQAVSERRGQRRQANQWRTSMRGAGLDFRHGARLLRRYPATSLLIVAMLALGIGANAAIFRVVDAVLWRALPYPDPDRLVMVWEKRPAEQVLNNVVSPADFLDWERRQQPFERIAAFVETQVTMTGQGEPRRVSTAAVTAGFFDVLGVLAAKGRTFRQGEDQFPQHRVAVISHGLWQRQFGGDEQIVGRSVVVNGNGWEIVGVLPREFAFPDGAADFWVPMILETPTAPAPRASHQLVVYARLKPGVSIDQARDAMDRLGKEIEAEHSELNRGHSAWVTSMRDEAVGSTGKRLSVIFGAVGLVLLIACVNVANLLLARAARRRREMAVRTALGADRARLIRLSLAESLTLATAGGAAGIGFALVLVRLLPLILPSHISVVSVEALGLDWRVVGFAIALAVATGVIVGVLPAISVSQRSIASSIAEGGRSAPTVRTGVRRLLIVSEIALATLTLVGAALVLRSFGQVMSQPLGFAPEGRLTFGVSVPVTGYANSEARVAALARIEERLAALAGVKHVGGVNLLPLSGGDSRTGIGFEGRERRPDDPPTRMHPRIVTPDYFKAMDIRIVRGRGFTSADGNGNDPVVIVSEAAAAKFWPGGDPLNTRVTFSGTSIWRTVVGIAADVRHWGLTLPTNPMIYWPQAQAQSTFLTFVLATDLDPGSLTTAARAQVTAVDPNLPLAEVRSLDRVVADSTRTERAQTILMVVFGVLALALAMTGAYAVMAQLVTARTPEIGVRMTLGARPSDVLRQFVGEGLWQTVGGTALGIAAGVFLMTLGRDVLFGVEPWDATALVAAALAMTIAGLAACLVPARRAMRTDPVNALRS